VRPDDPSRPDDPFPSPAADTPRDLLPLPRAGALLLWTAAYLRGDIGPDDAAQTARGRGHRESVGAGLDPFEWMTGLRRLPLADVRLVLPVPGRIAGLIGPPPAITAALGAGQAVVVTAAGFGDHTLVPVMRDLGRDPLSGTLVTWTRIDAPADAVPPPTGSGSAREDFLRALQRAADGTTELDLVPEEPVPLATLPTGWVGVPVPRHVTGPTRHLLELSARTVLLTGQELESGSPHTIDLTGAAARPALLRDLADGARAALTETLTGIVGDELG
jgi:hypothetical protein